MFIEGPLIKNCVNMANALCERAYSILLTTRACFRPSWPWTTFIHLKTNNLTAAVCGVRHLLFCTTTSQALLVFSACLLGKSLV